MKTPFSQVLKGCWIGVAVITGFALHERQEANAQAQGSRVEQARTVVEYPDGRPSAHYRLEAKDYGIVLRHGNGPLACDSLGARDVWVWENRGKYYIHYDGAGPGGWLSCLATSDDLLHWSLKGPVLLFGKPGSKDAASASYGTTFFDGRRWHMFYLGTPNTSPAPDRVPAFPYLTMKAEANSPEGPWKKRYDITPFSPEPGSYYSATASPGQILRFRGEYLMFFSASTDRPILRTIGIARTQGLDGPWRADPGPILPLEEQVENTSFYFERSSKTWFLFTNHVGLKDGLEYTDAVWVYWTKDLNHWDKARKAVVLDGSNCSWSRQIVGLPSVVHVKDRLAIFYDGNSATRMPAGAKSHMEREIGLAWLDLPITVPEELEIPSPSGTLKPQATVSPSKPGSLRVGSLRCESEVNPLGVDTPSPHLAWVLEPTNDSLRNLRQTAFQVILATEKGLLSEAAADMWNSGKLSSGENFSVRYGGKPLPPHRELYWKARVWDGENRVSAWSRPSRFTTGLPAESDWRAQWIMGDTSRSAALPLFRKEFSLPNPVRRAVLCVCGLGQYELRLNGARVGDRVLDPGWTNYRKTCLYATYDVTSKIRKGKNTLGVLLGNGMYNVTGGRYVKFTGSFGPPKLILQLVVEHTDGSETSVVSDSTWRTSPGPITFSCIYGGEDYDARREMPGWDRTSFNDQGWQRATVTEGPGGALRSQTAPPVKVFEEFGVVRITQPKPGVFVYDLGQNFSGWPKLTVRGPLGATVKLIPGELLESSGLVTQQHSGTPQWFSYTLRGKGTEEWAPRFSYYGFRYVQVEGAAPEEDALSRVNLPEVISLKGQFIHSAAPLAGDFACSNDLINRIHRLIRAAIRSNLQSVLTDCPHREKLGWLEQSYLLAGGIMFNHDVQRLYAKISQDMAESQLSNGLVPDIAPEYTVFSAGFRDSPEWGSACVFNPWNVYVQYGDRSLLEAQYDVMARYVRYLGGTAQGHIVSHGLGDWYDIGPKDPGTSQLTSTGLTATATYYADIMVLEKTAETLRRDADVKRYSALADSVRREFNSHFFRADSHLYDRGSQTALAMPLVTGLVPEGERQGVVENLVRSVATNNYRVTAGDVGFMYVVQALKDACRNDVLYAMVTQKEGPGYADQLRKGATTLTEAWDANSGSSQNHCMLGHAEEWFFSGLAGIRPDDAGPGFRRVIIRPAVLGGLSWVQAHYDSPQGRLSSSWERRGKTLILQVRVPPNTIGRIYVPAASPESIKEGGVPVLRRKDIRQVGRENDVMIFEVGSGMYAFEARLPQ